MLLLKVVFLSTAFTYLPGCVVHGDNGETIYSNVTSSRGVGPTLMIYSDTGAHGSYYCFSNPLQDKVTESGRF